jgi:hypothetical protein
MTPSLNKEGEPEIYRACDREVAWSNMKEGAGVKPLPNPLLGQVEGIGAAQIEFFFWCARRAVNYCGCQLAPPSDVAKFWPEAVVTIA